MSLLPFLSGYETKGKGRGGKTCGSFCLTEKRGKGDSPKREGKKGKDETRSSLFPPTLQGPGTKGTHIVANRGAGEQ